MGKLFVYEVKDGKIISEQFTFDLAPSVNTSHAVSESGLLALALPPHSDSLRGARPLEVALCCPID